MYILSKVIECLEQNFQKQIDYKRPSSTKQMNRVDHNIFALKYREILLIRPGRIYGQRTNLMGLYLEGGLYTGGLIFGTKNTSICNLLNLLLFFLFSSIKLVFWDISRHARCEICSRLIVKAPEYLKLTMKLTIKTPLMSPWSLYC